MRRVIIKYMRQGAAEYISHLDMQRAFGRAIRRADIEAEYSQGFNPHIVMSFASPLSVGYATNADYLEIAVEDGCDTESIGDRLNAVLTDDLRVMEAFETEYKKKLMSVNHSAEYRMIFGFENESGYVRIQEALEKIVNCDHYMAAGRKGGEIDVIPLILGAEYKDRGINAVLRNSSAASLNPAVLRDAVLNEAGAEADVRICRTECYAEVEGRVIPFSALKDIT